MSLEKVFQIKCNLSEADTVEELVLLIGAPKIGHPIGENDSQRRHVEAPR